MIIWNGDKEQLKQVVGEYRMFSGKSEHMLFLDYIGGSSLIDSKVEDPTKNRGVLINKAKGLLFVLSESFVISDTDILKWSIQNNDKSAKSKKSLLGRALIGGLALGPAGVLLGGISSLDDKVIGHEAIFSLLIDNGGKEELILFGLKSKKIPKIKKMLSYELATKEYAERSDSILSGELKSQSNSEIKSSNNIAREIREMKQLLDEGLITTEEFESFKSKILNKN